MAGAGFGRGKVADSASGKSARKLPSATVCRGLWRPYQKRGRGMDDKFQFPNDENGDVLRRMQTNGDDLS